MTYVHFMNAQEMQNCPEKHPASRASNGNTEKFVIARWSTN